MTESTRELRLALGNARRSEPRSVDRWCVCGDRPAPPQWRIGNVRSAVLQLLERRAWALGVRRGRRRRARGRQCRRAQRCALRPEHRVRLLARQHARVVAGRRRHRHAAPLRQPLRVVVRRRRRVPRATPSNTSTASVPRSMAPHATGGAERVALSLSATLLEPIERLGTSPAGRGAMGEPLGGRLPLRAPRGDLARGRLPTGEHDRSGSPVGARSRDWRSPRDRHRRSRPRSSPRSSIRDGPRNVLIGGRADEQREPAEPAGAMLPGGVDLDGTFLDRRTDGTFLVADGGILDNIPLARAIRDIVTAPAGGPTHRVLLYLQPGAPSHHAKGRAGAPGKRRAILHSPWRRARVPNGRDDLAGHRRAREPHGGGRIARVPYAARRLPG